MTNDVWIDSSGQEVLLPLCPNCNREGHYLQFDGQVLHCIFCGTDCGLTGEMIVYDEPDDDDYDPPSEQHISRDQPMIGKIEGGPAR